jgi:hypothetical protein
MISFIAVLLFLFGLVYSAASLISGMMMSDREAAELRIRRGATVGFWLFLIPMIVFSLVGQ